MIRIDNWPPGYYPPTGFVDPPPGLVRQIADMKDALAELQVELHEWECGMIPRRLRAWVAYHDETGWPDDPDYRQRLTHAANDSMRVSE